ncbi:MAG: hypothetical protein J6W00_14305 [Lentisphaeria bacterium]|nr:hypothetical protein [Lentisphaeria bacterium]
MKYYGIDITQHKEHCISAELNEGSFTCTRNNPVSCLPAAILPEYRGESVVMASDAESDCHNKTLLQRRGLGLLWPRDTQIPVGQKDWNNGIGRVPLLSCLSNIKEAGNADEWKLIESRISWTPHPGKQLSFSNAELLGGLFKKIKDAEQICFVVPEEFGENAQQTLLEEFPENTLLIPRSIALAVQWCKDHREQYSHLHFPMGESKSLGHL